jgi:hypothetical protein
VVLRVATNGRGIATDGAGHAASLGIGNQ